MLEVQQTSRPGGAPLLNAVAQPPTERTHRPAGSVATSPGCPTAAYTESEVSAPISCGLTLLLLGQMKT